MAQIIDALNAGKQVGQMLQPTMKQADGAQWYKDQQANKAQQALKQAMAQGAPAGMPPAEYLRMLADKIGSIDPDQAFRLRELAYKEDLARINNPANKAPSATQSTQKQSVWMKAFSGVADEAGYQQGRRYVESVSPAFLEGVPLNYDAEFVATATRKEATREGDTQGAVAKALKNAASVLTPTMDQNRWTAIRRNLISRTTGIEDYLPEDVNEARASASTWATGNAQESQLKEFDIEKSQYESQDYAGNLGPKQQDLFNDIVFKFQTDKIATNALQIMSEATKLEAIIGNATTLDGFNAVATTFSTMKSLDPGSVVRESEVAMFQQADGVINNIKAKADKVAQAEGPVAAANALSQAVLTSGLIEQVKKLAKTVRNQAGMELDRRKQAYIGMGKSRGITDPLTKYFTDNVIGATEYKEKK